MAKQENVMQYLKEFSKLLYETCQKFQEEYHVIVHTITIEDNYVKFEVWSVKDDTEGTVMIKKYNYEQKRKKDEKKL